MIMFDRWSYSEFCSLAIRLSLSRLTIFFIFGIFIEFLIAWLQTNAGSPAFVLAMCFV